jgi:cytochrome c oxidase subunit 4
MTEHEAQGGDHGHGDHGHGGHGHASHGGIGKYIAVFVALCVFTAISFAIANSPIMDNPAIGWFGMMAVSCCKALLVVLFFMHLKWEANWKYVLTVPASIMSVFLIIMLVPDIGLRTRHYSEERWKNAAVPHASDSAQGQDHSDQQGSGGHSSGGGGGH